MPIWDKGKFNDTWFYMYLVLSWTKKNARGEISLDNLYDYFEAEGRRGEKREKSCKLVELLFSCNCVLSWYGPLLLAIGADKSSKIDFIHVCSVLFVAKKWRINDLHALSCFFFYPLIVSAYSEDRLKGFFYYVNSSSTSETLDWLILNVIGSIVCRGHKNVILNKVS